MSTELDKQSLSIKVGITMDQATIQRLFNCSAMASSNKIVALFALCLVFCLLAETSAQYYGYGYSGYSPSYYGSYGYASPYYGGYYGGYGYGAYGYYGKRDAGFQPNQQQ